MKFSLIAFLTALLFLPLSSIADPQDGKPQVWDCPCWYGTWGMSEVRWIYDEMYDLHWRIYHYNGVMPMAQIHSYGMETETGHYVSVAAVAQWAGEPDELSYCTVRVHDKTTAEYREPRITEGLASEFEFRACFAAIRELKATWMLVPD